MAPLMNPYVTCIWRNKWRDIIAKCQCKALGKACLPRLMEKTRGKTSLPSVKMCENASLHICGGHRLITRHPFSHVCIKMRAYFLQSTPPTNTYCRSRVLALCIPNLHFLTSAWIFDTRQRAIAAPKMRFSIHETITWFGGHFQSTKDDAMATAATSFKEIVIASVPFK